MKVKATKLGFYGARRYPGDVFDVPEGQKGSWFEPVGGVSEEYVKPKRGRKAEPESDELTTFSAIAKKDGESLYPSV